MIFATKIKKTLIVFSALLALSATGIFAISNVSNAQSSSLTGDQVEQIKANCVSIKSTLSQLHANDALLRVNQGQIYESMAGRLMERFNTRLVGNGLDARAMITVTDSYNAMLNTFRNDYIAYEQKLSVAISTDCKTQPVDFYNNVESARALRKAVHEDVLKLHEYINDYRTSVSDFLLNFERLSK